ncbi:MerR family transcriptional regulator [bacterium]|nr:MerR family transcriptional regulator [bacterium]
MDISEFAKTFGVRPSALRFYERIGILNPAGRVSGRRLYDKAAETRLAFILSARESGFTLSEIKGLISTVLNGNPPRRVWPAAAEVKRLNLEKEINRLKAAQRSLKHQAGCQCRTLRECETKLAKERRSASARKISTSH